jgi:beta-glucosidase
MDLFSFPENFVWGAASSSFQIEGAFDEEGKGLSTWDVFTRRPGKILNDDTGDIACDHYHLYKEDVALMKELGLKSYRFSISWPRIFPEGEGSVNKQGLDFYDRLIDELLAKDIMPFVTLFHWDLPQALEVKYGGWRNKKVSRLFADYTAVVAKKYSDRVKYFSTVNEIDCYTLVAHKMYGGEKHAPGKAEPDKVVNQIVHNALLGHGLSCQALRANCPSDVKVGIVDNSRFPMPVYETKENIDAAKKAFISLNSQILMPLMTGKYSDLFLKREKDNVPDFTESEMKIISSPLDFIGYNYYQSPMVRASDNEAGYEILTVPQGYPKTCMGWAITPLGIYYGLKFHKEFFGNLPVYIAENGCSSRDIELPNGEIIDIERIEFLRQHLMMVNLALKEGVDVRGYFVWTLMDNFEWSYGYTERFGIVRVNYTDMKRTVKSSGHYYKEVMKGN